MERRHWKNIPRGWSIAWRFCGYGRNRDFMESWRCIWIVEKGRDGVALGLRDLD